MKPTPHIPPLRWILPFAQLFLCALILWPLHQLLVNEIASSLRAYGILHDTPGSDRVAPGERPLEFFGPEVQRNLRGLQEREWTVAALNFPGCLPDLVQAVVSPAHSAWTPRGMLEWTWRALSWPIVSVFFWWLAGRSIEALLLARQRILLPKIRWWEVVVSLPVLMLGAISAVSVTVDQSSHAEPFSQLLLIFGSVWFILGICTPTARVAQWRLRKQLTSAPNTLLD
jgi:hypothetical protein